MENLVRAKLFGKKNPVVHVVHDGVIETKR
jgi:hypothetical protein